MEGPTSGNLDVVSFRRHGSRKSSALGVQGAIAPQAGPRFSRTPGKAQAEAPLPGADCEAVFAEIGIDAAEFAKLRAADVLG
jgi:crotonobetainyl-CoA:carnitine CoA-transferase CaiB-like acyl-CoA transferase